MKYIAVLSLCFVAVTANYGYNAPAPASPPVQSSPPMATPYYGGSMKLSAPAPQIVRLHHEIRENANNNVQYETSHGIKSVDNTQILPGTPNPENPSEMWNKIAKSGSYSYTSPEGVPVNIQWTADSNGFRATGDAIPTSPPIPAEILKSLAQNAYSAPAPASPSMHSYQPTRQSSNYY